MEKAKIKAYVEKTINWIKKKGHIIFEFQPDITFDRVLIEYVFMATRLRIYERAVEVYDELKKSIPNMKKLNVLIGR